MFSAGMLIIDNAHAADSLIVATNPTWPPMQVVDINKQIVGFEIDLIAAVGKEAGYDVKFMNTAWDGIFGTLESGNADIIASTVTITDARKKRYLFSDPIYEMSQALVVPIGSEISVPTNLDGKRVGVQIGTTAVESLKKMGVDVEIITYDEVGLAFEDLINGRVDAVMCDDPVARNYASRKEGYAEKMDLAFVTADKEFVGVVALKKNAALIAKLNAALKTLRKNGKEKEIYEKWFGSK